MEPICLIGHEEVSRSPTGHHGNAMTVARKPAPNAITPDLHTPHMVIAQEAQNVTLGRIHKASRLKCMRRTVALLTFPWAPVHDQ